MTPRNQVLIGNAIDLINCLKESSIDTVITSPPYFSLRDYGHIDQIGSETRVEDWINKLLLVIDGIARVLKPTGSLWLNIGDTYSRSIQKGAKPKSLLLGPERLGVELIKRGWIIRNKVIWAKTNPMPQSVKDRLSNSHEIIYFATRSNKYFFDLDLIREPHLTTRPPKKQKRSVSYKKHSLRSNLDIRHSGLKNMKMNGIIGHELGKNPGDVWQIATSNYSGAHFATFPESLITKPLLSTCPAKVCFTCGSPWIRAKHVNGQNTLTPNSLHATCNCKSETIPGIVLDPFMGAGTVAKAAEDLHRDWLGIELNPKYVSLINMRINKEEGGKNLY